MDIEQIIPCAICANPQKVNTEKIYSAVAEATKTSIQEVRSSNFEFICFNCMETATYKSDYFSNDDKPHVALAEKAAVIYN